MVDNIVEHQDDEFVSLLQIEDIPESEDDVSPCSEPRKSRKKR